MSSLRCCAEPTSCCSSPSTSTSMSSALGLEAASMARVSATFLSAQTNHGWLQQMRCPQSRQHASLPGCCVEPASCCLRRSASCSMSLARGLDAASIASVKATFLSAQMRSAGGVADWRFAAASRPAATAEKSASSKAAALLACTTSSAQDVAFINTHTHTSQLSDSLERPDAFCRWRGRLTPGRCVSSSSKCRVVGLQQSSCLACLRSRLRSRCPLLAA